MARTVRMSGDAYDMLTSIMDRAEEFACWVDEQARQVYENGGSDAEKFAMGEAEILASTLVKLKQEMHSTPQAYVIEWYAKTHTEYWTGDDWHGKPFMARQYKTQASAQAVITRQQNKLADDWRKANVSEWWAARWVGAHVVRKGMAA